MRLNSLWYLRNNLANLLNEVRDILVNDASKFRSNCVTILRLLEKDTNEASEWVVEEGHVI